MMHYYSLFYQPTPDAVTAATPWVAINYIILAVETDEPLTDDERQTMESRFFTVLRDWRFVGQVEAPKGVEA